MNLLFLTHCFFPAKEGGAILLSQLASFLTRKNKVVAITSDCFSSDGFVNRRLPRIKKKRTKWQKVVIFRLPVVTRLRKFFRLLELLTRWDFFALLAKGPVFKQLRHLFKKRQVDWVIGAPFPTLSVFWAWLIAKRNRAKLALIPCFHQEDKEYFNSVLLKITKSAQAVFCLTETEKRFWKKQGVKEKNLQVIGGIVPPEVFSFSRRKRTQKAVLFLGVKAAHKRLEFLLKAMRIVWKENPEVKLFLVGPETLSSRRIKTKILSLPQRLQKQILWKGKVSEREKVDFLDQAAMLVNPSCQESFGIVFTEAWARKKPVIGAKIPVLEELIDDGKEGLLFSPNDFRDLGEKILFLLMNPSLREKMGKRGYIKVRKKYQPEIVAEKVFSFLEKKQCL